MRRRAISSRIVAATCRLCSAESCLSGVGIVPPFKSGNMSEHDLFGKPVSTFPDHAICLSMIFSEDRYPPSDQVRGHAFPDHASSRRTIQHKTAQLRLG